MRFWTLIFSLLFVFITPTSCIHKSKCSGFFIHWPVSSARLTQGFRPPQNPNHMGIDLAGPIGTPIYAAQQGRVIYVGNKYRGYGKTIIIKHSNSFTTLYAHLNKILVKKGTQVAQGQKIALMGNTGRSTGPHLHFEVIRGSQPEPPLAFLRNQCKN